MKLSAYVTQRAEGHVDPRLELELTESARATGVPPRVFAAMLLRSAAARPPPPPPRRSKKQARRAQEAQDAAWSDAVRAQMASAPSSPKPAPVPSPAADVDAFAFELAYAEASLTAARTPRAASKPAPRKKVRAMAKESRHTNTRASSNDDDELFIPSSITDEALEQQGKLARKLAKAEDPAEKVARSMGYRDVKDLYEKSIDAKELRHDGVIAIGGVLHKPNGIGGWAPHMRSAP